MFERLKAWAQRAKRDAIALWFAARDPRSPWWARAFLWLVVAYALSPIDLIPDFIPVIGLLDEALLLPLAIWIALRIVPAQVIADGRARAATVNVRPRLLLGAALIIGLWLAIAAVVVRLLITPN